MRFKYKSLLLIVALLIGICTFLGVSYFLYTKVINNKTIVVVDGNITINYLNGNKLNYKKNPVTFSVTNNGEEDAYYYIEFKDVSKNNVSYNLKGKDNDINVTNNLVSDIVSSYIEIPASFTQNYELVFLNDESEPFSGQIVVGLESSEVKTMFADAILANNKVVEAKTSFNEVALEEEGLIKTLDDNGNSYYFRGSATNNYVSFANLTWRIVRINGDGSVKLVLDGILETLSAYYEKDDYTFLNSNIKKQLDDWYDLSLKDYADYIANYKFCNDLLIDDGASNYASYNRVLLDFIPNNVCLGTRASSKIGLLTIDEVVMAGAGKSENKAYYLYNSEINTSYYTLSGAKKTDSTFYPFMVKTDGSIDYETSGTLLRAIRPVINIIKNIEVDGDGTKDNPYVIIEKE